MYTSRRAWASAHPSNHGPQADGGFISTCESCTSPLRGSGMWQLLLCWQFSAAEVTQPHSGSSEWGRATHRAPMKQTESVSRPKDQSKNVDSPRAKDGNSELLRTTHSLCWVLKTSASSVYEWPFAQVWSWDIWKAVLRDSWKWSVFPVCVCVRMTLGLWWLCWSDEATSTSCGRWSRKK